MSPSIHLLLAEFFRLQISRRSASQLATLVGILLLMHGANTACSAAPLASGNALTYLDDSDPFYVGARFPKLITPQWVGEKDVDAVVILAIDDMTESARYELMLRPLIERLKTIDGRAPISIMTRSVATNNPLVAKWLREGLSIEVHTLQHPCPLLANGDFEAAATNYYGCIDLLNGIPGNKPVAFRMPCCDSLNSTSPRFFSELFNHPSPAGNFLSIDSSVINLLTSDDSELPRDVILDADGKERFRKYFPKATNATTRVSLGGFGTTIENYPYPYTVGRLCWEFPCAVPSDWEAFNALGATNQVTVDDWKRGLDAVVTKKGVFTMIFHPHGWIRSDQLVELVDYAVDRYGKRVKFLTFQEALARLNQNLLLGEPLRAQDSKDNGVRLVDLNRDGYLDVIVANEHMQRTRIWDPSSGSWKESDFPDRIVAAEGAESHRDAGFRFGLIHTGLVSVFCANEQFKGAWTFREGQWREEKDFFNGLKYRGEALLTSRGGLDRGIRFRDIDNDGQCELLLGNESQNAIFKWSESEAGWKKLAFSLPDGTSIVNASGEDNGLRFIDLNGDGYDDAVFSNEAGYSVHIFIAHPKPWLGWDVGWSYKVRSGRRDAPGAIPMIVRSGAHRDNGCWFHDRALWAQNEDTAAMPDKVAKRSFDELQMGEESPAKSPEQALASFHVPEGMQIELVASEPAIVDPVAFDWGADGKLWVVEMRDYPLGMDNHGKPGGEIRVLEDTHEDGHYDKATTFMEGIGFPNGIMPWGKGVLVSAAPDIFYAEDTDGDGRADVRRLLYTGFRQGNQQHRVNGFEYGLDNWVYAANGGSGGVIRSVAGNQELNLRGHDLRMKPDDALMELEPGATQFGRHRNDWGDWFGNDNSRWLWHYFLPERYLARNAFLKPASLFRQLAEYPGSSRIFSLSAAQQRFNWPSALFEVTSACSANPYRDSLLGPEYETSVFICEPANNVIHREVLELSGVSFVSHRAVNETNSEFFASSDNWCRPVMVRTGPDGALYLADMYRLVIEHPEYFPDELKQRPDLRAGEDKGRIYRIYPKGKTLRPIPRLNRLDDQGLVAALDSENGWQRDTAQRLLVERRATKAIPTLEQLIRRTNNPKARLQALCTISGLGLTPQQILVERLKDSHWAVRREAVLLSETRAETSPELANAILELEGDPDLRVRYQLAFSLGEWKDSRAGRVLGRLMMKDWTDSAMQLALLSSAIPHLREIVVEVFDHAKNAEIPASLAEEVVRLITETDDETLLTSVLDPMNEAAANGSVAWPVAGMNGLLNALDSNEKTWDDFQKAAGKRLGKALDRLALLFDKARTLSQGQGTPISDEERLMAIGLLGRGPSQRQDGDMQLLGELLGPQQSRWVQEAALAGLQHGHGGEVGKILLKQWRACGTILRQEVLNTLLGRGEWVSELISALERGTVQPGELGPLQQQKLLNYPDAAIRNRSVQLFASIDADRRKVVEAYKDVAQLQGDRTKGHELFVKNCSICHRLSGEGQSVGPDLGTVADKPVQELLVAILDPNQAVDPAYVAYSAVTKDDREVSGVLASETGNSISLRVPGGAEERVLRSDLKQLTSSGRSLMPEGFETGFKRQDLADLIAYVLNPTR